MSERKWIASADPNNKYGGILTLGVRPAEVPEGAVVSITLGEDLNLLQTIVNGIATQFVQRQMVKAKGLLFAELKGDLKKGLGLTVSVWESKQMVPFRDKGAHGWVARFMKWVFYGHKAQAYFLTYLANGQIPTVDEAYDLVKAYGRHLDRGVQVRSASRPVFHG